LASQILLKISVSVNGCFQQGGNDLFAAVQGFARSLDLAHAFGEGDDVGVAVGEQHIVLQNEGNRVQDVLIALLVQLQEVVVCNDFVVGFEIAR